MAKQRLLWPDVAKGLSIIGVVVLHVSLLVPGARDTALSQANTYLDPLRMPLFFLVSGLFSAKVLNFTLPELFRKRLWFFLVPYVVWVPIELSLTSKVRHIAGMSEPYTRQEYWELLWTGRNMAWFLAALILFNLALWATKFVPRWAVPLIAVSPLVVIQQHHDIPLVAKAVMYLPIFIAGAYLRHNIKRYAATALTPIRILFALAGFLSAVVVVISWNVRVAQPEPVSITLPLWGTLDNTALQLVVNLTQYMLMLPAGVLLAVALSQVAAIARPLQFLGQRTLPIYLGHPIGMTLLISFPREIYDLPIGEDPTNPWMDTNLWIVAALAASAAGSVAMLTIGKIPGVRWVLYPPALPQVEPVVTDTHRLSLRRTPDPSVVGSQASTTREGHSSHG